MSNDGLEPSRVHRILVVDDTEMNRDMLSRRLQRRGYDTESVEDGERALQAVADGDYDLILLDVMMPGIDGLEVLTRLRETYSMTELPIIMATAKDESADVVDAFKKGANDYVTKPLDFPVVLQRVRTQLQLKDTSAALAAQTEFIRRVFGRYVTREVVDNLLETPEGLTLGGERREITILMSDLRGFSAMCERLAPEDVISVLNLYLGEMVDCIQRAGGTVDEFIGDGILAIFGAPIERKDHAARGIACALDMQRSMAGINATLAERGLPALEMGIGVHTGEVIVGNIGSASRAKYGVVGAPVNQTGRIESYTVGGQVLSSTETEARLGGDMIVRRRFDVVPKGAAVLTLCDVMGLRGAGEDGADLVIDDGSIAPLDLDTPLSLRLFPLEGKQVRGDERPATLVAASVTDGVLLDPAGGLKPLDNVRLRPGDGAPDGLDVYAKVLGLDGDRVELRFTMLSPEAQSWLRESTPAAP